MRFRYPVVPFTDISEFAPRECLGHGTFGTVLKAHYGGRIVAAKLVESNVDFHSICKEVGLCVFWRDMRHV